MVLSGDAEINYILFPILLFPTISGLIMFYGKTVYHGLAFLGVHSFPVFGGISYFFTQYFHCRDKTTVCNANNPIYYAGVGLLVALVVIFQLLHTLYVYLIWKKRIWPLVYEFKHSRHDEIKGMHATYEVQFPLFHAQTMMIGLWLVAYLTGVIGIDLVLLTKRRIRARNLFINYLVPFNIIFLYYSFFMLKGVRDEKRYLMYIVYVGNVIQAIFLYLDLESYCKKYAFIKKLDSPLQCLQYNMVINMFSLYACLCWIVLALSTWNTIRCHKNFNKNMSTYITYEPAPPEFKTGRKFVKRESSEPKYSHIV
ncbi:unnamed protein product [Rhizophagus irregularis]|nr:unnamed protein product [Rhizophagus irregularis]CAB4481527.1 unnamed protein product [Rhizophagus irregularis]CAB5375020.1 unnamed protein product [Rhizophagus irregularis]